MSNVDERQPLLPPAALASSPLPTDLPPSYAHDEENQVTEPGGEAEVVKVKEERSWWSIVWRAILTGVVILFLVLLIKGFIEADDVEFDLGKALMSALGGGLSGAAGTCSSTYSYMHVLSLEPSLLSVLVPLPPNIPILSIVK
ncbi:hypothetical protein BC835DRAFT_1332930 [Cytidiella melzeri]|nr:hypothetical protein BC835DRAFT_1332930 [Cytidiella melzeri]